MSALDLANSFVTSFLSVGIMLSVFRAGGDTDVLFPVILGTLSHTHDKAALMQLFLLLTACWHSSDHHGPVGRQYCPLLLGMDASAARWIHSVKWSTASWAHWKSHTDHCITAVDQKNSSLHVQVAISSPYWLEYHSPLGNGRFHVSLPWPAKFNATVHKVNQLIGEYSSLNLEE